MKVSILFFIIVISGIYSCGDPQNPYSLRSIILPNYGDKTLVIKASEITGSGETVVHAFTCYHRDINPDKLAKLSTNSLNEYCLGPKSSTPLELVVKAFTVEFTLENLRIQSNSTRNLYDSEIRDIQNDIRSIEQKITELEGIPGIPTDLLQSFRKKIESLRLALEGYESGATILADQISGIDRSITDFNDVAARMVLSLFTSDHIVISRERSQAMVTNILRKIFNTDISEEIIYSDNYFSGNFKRINNTDEIIGASGSRKIVIRDLRTFKIKKTFEFEEKFEFTSFAISDDNELVLLSPPNRSTDFKNSYLSRWDLNTGELQQVINLGLQTHEANINIAGRSLYYYLPAQTYIFRLNDFAIKNTYSRSRNALDFDLDNLSEVTIKSEATHERAATLLLSSTVNPAYHQIFQLPKEYGRSIPTLNHANTGGDTFLVAIAGIQKKTVNIYTLNHFGQKFKTTIPLVDNGPYEVRSIMLFDHNKKILISTTRKTEIFDLGTAVPDKIFSHYHIQGIRKVEFNSSHWFIDTKDEIYIFDRNTWQRTDLKLSPKSSIHKFVDLDNSNIAALTSDGNVHIFSSAWQQITLHGTLFHNKKITEIYAFDIDYGTEDSYAGFVTGSKDEVIIWEKRNTDQDHETSQQFIKRETIPASEFSLHPSRPILAYSKYDKLIIRNLYLTEETSMTFEDEIENIVLLPQNHRAFVQISWSNPRLLLVDLKEKKILKSVIRERMDHSKFRLSPFKNTIDHLNGQGRRINLIDPKTLERKLPEHINFVHLDRESVAWTESPEYPKTNIVFFNHNSGTVTKKIRTISHLRKLIPFGYHLIGGIGRDGPHLINTRNGISVPFILRVRSDRKEFAAIISTRDASRIYYSFGKGIFRYQR